MWPPTDFSVVCSLDPKKVPHSYFSSMLKLMLCTRPKGLMINGERKKSGIAAVFTQVCLEHLRLHFYLAVGNKEQLVVRFRCRT